MSYSERRYANQNHIEFVNKPKSKKLPRNDYNRAALMQAMQNLSALKIYLYLGGFRHTDGGIYLSKQDVLSSTGLSEHSYFSAKKELKEKGYIYQDPNTEGTDWLVFSEAPKNV